MKFKYNVSPDVFEKLREAEEAEARAIVEKAIYKIRELKHVNLELNSFYYHKSSYGGFGIYEASFSDNNISHIYGFYDVEDIALCLREDVFSTEVFPDDIKQGLTKFSDADRILLRVTKRIYAAWKQLASKYYSAKRTKIQIDPYAAYAEIDTKVTQELCDRFKAMYRGDWSVCRPDSEVIIDLGEKKHE